MGILPALTSVHAAAGWSIQGLTFGPPARGPVSALAEGVKSSMFAETPLDNRTTKEIKTWSGVAARCRANLRIKDDERNELIFRHHRRFGNIETYMRQYG